MDGRSWIERGEGCCPRNVWAIKSCRVAKTPSEFYLSFEPSPRLTAIGRESPATSADFPSPSPSSGGQTLIGLDSTSLSLSFFPALSPFLENPRSLLPISSSTASHISRGHFSCSSNERPRDTSAIVRPDRWRISLWPSGTGDIERERLSPLKWNWPFRWSTLFSYLLARGNESFRINGMCVRVCLIDVGRYDCCRIFV